MKPFTDSTLMWQAIRRWEREQFKAGLQDGQAGKRIRYRDRHYQRGWRKGKSMSPVTNH